MEIITIKANICWGPTVCLHYIKHFTHKIGLYKKGPSIISIYRCESHDTEKLNNLPKDKLASN